jgi:dTDP-4-dehydrorhamnose reductase
MNDNYMKILILGNGYLGTRAKEVWGDEAVLATTRIRSTDDVRALIREHHPDAIFNAAGVTGKPNVDWCETHQLETILGNTVLPMQIAEAAGEAGIYLLHLATGCIFYGHSPHDDGVWTEADYGNPVAVYSKSKYAADLVLSTLPNVGIARLRMPIDDRPSPANLIDKITTYPKVVDVENSVTVVPDLLDACYQLMQQKGEGIFHCTNPGTISHKEIISLYIELVDGAHRNEWITEEELVAQGFAKKKRSNNVMRSTRLQALGIEMRDIRTALRDTMEKYAKVKNNTV